MQSEAPSFQCASKDPGTGWDQADVAVRRDIEAATFQVVQRYNKKVLAVWRLPLSQLIQSAFLSDADSRPVGFKKTYARAACKKIVADLKPWQCSTHFVFVRIA